MRRSEEISIGVVPFRAGQIIRRQGKYFFLDRFYKETMHLRGREIDFSLDACVDKPKETVVEMFNREKLKSAVIVADILSDS